MMTGRLGADQIEDVTDNPGVCWLAKSHSYQQAYGISVRIVHVESGRERCLHSHCIRRGEVTGLSHRDLPARVQVIVTIEAQGVNGDRQC